MNYSTTVTGGLRRVLFCLLLTLLTWSAYGQTGCDCPPNTSCQPCTGGLVSLSIEYTPGVTLGCVTAVDGNGQTLSSGLLTSNTITFYSVGYPSTPFGGGKVIITAKHVACLLQAAQVTIQTDCSQPIYQGISYQSGDFVILGGESVGGVELCCSSSGEPTNPPIVSGCPSNISVSAANGFCGANVTWTAPTAINNNCGDTHAAGRTSDHNPGDFFNVGTTSVTYTFTDDYGNTANCSFNVTVNDTQLPQITCPANKTSVADANCSFVLPDYRSEAVVTDNCGTGGITITQSPVAGSTVSGLSPHTITLTAKDAANNTSQCTFTVTLTDNIAPQITTCVSNKTVTANSNCEFVLPDYTSEVVATDNCGVGGITITQSPAAGSTVSGLLPNTITITAKDASNNSSQCTFTVTLTDNTAPQITTCVSNKTAVANANCEFVLPDYRSEVVTTDNCGNGGVTITQSPAAGSTISGLLPNTITITAKDASNNTSQCTFTVTLTDNIAPQITTCVSNKTATANATNCTFVLPDYRSEVVATDNCGNGGVTITQSPAAGSTISGLLPNTITITAKDASNNTSQCTFTVTLTDNTAPLITCPANKTAAANAACSFTLPNYTTEAITSDNCGGSVTVTQSPAAGTTVTGITAHTITLTAKDAANNTSQCTFTVTLTDNIAPQITCPANKTAQASANCTFTLPDYTGEAVTSDNCGGTITVTQDPVPGTILSGLGAHTITFTAKDASNNTSQCTFFSLTLTDNIKPQITCPANKTAAADASCSFVLPNYTTEATATDNCGGAVTITQSPAAGTTVSGLIAHTITLTATDVSNNSKQCTFTLTLIDNTAPQITCPANNTATMNASCSFTVPNYTTEAVTSDNCGGTITVTQSPVAGTVINTLGAQTITLTAKDAANNSSQCTFTVTLSDNTAPQITTCVSNKTVTADANCSFVLPDYTSQAIATDNCGSGGITITQNPAAGSTVSGLTAHTVTITAKDAANNSSQCTFTVTLTDNTAPQITTCVPNKTATADANCSFVLPDYRSEVVATDNCGSGGITITQSPAAGSTINGILPNTITITAKDASNNTAQCTFTVTLTDNTAPQITTCVPNKTATANANCEFVLPNYTSEVVAADNCGVGGITITQSPAAGSTISGLLPNTITITAKDASNNTSQCTFTVTLTDNTAPQITTCVPNKTAAANANCEFVLPDYTSEAIATDNCGGGVTFTQSPAAGSTISGISAHTITITAKDASNNTSQCTFTVTLTDNLAPQITTCVSNKTVASDANCSFVLPDYTSEAVVTGNCAGGGITITQSPAAGQTVSGLTAHTVTITAKDASNNSTQCTFTVTLTDNTAPQITTCVPNKTAAADASCSFVLPDYTSEAIVSDNCGAGGVTITQNPAAGSTVSGLIPHTITITAKDASNNSSQCTFTVTLTDNTAPQITTCVPNKTVTADANCSFVLPDYTSEAIATDNCGAGGITITQSPAAGATLNGLLPHTITITAKDASNNTSQCTFIVTLSDNTAPQITSCVPNKTATADANCSFVLPDYTSEAIATDNCGTGGITITQSPSAGSTVSGLIAHTITITAKDASNNSSQCTFTVTLTDNTAPQITTCVPNKTATADANCSFVLPDYTSEAVATDNCGVGGVTITQSPAAGSTVTGILPHTITITAKDASNNTSQCTFTVTLTDNTGPQITTCVPNNTATANSNCEFVLPDYTSEVVATDNCGVGGVTITQSPAAGSTVSGLLPNTITITAKDASNNTSQCTFTVTLTDNTAPQITTCVPNKTATANSNCEFVLPDYTSEVVATDNCGVGGVTITQSPAAGSTVSGLLPNTITITAKDASNNTSQCTFTVTLTDNIAPQITTCVSNKITVADANCSFVLPDYTSEAIATDNCGAGGVTITQSPAAGSTVSGLTAHTITVTAKDASNNSTQCTFTVTLTDNIAPQITTCALNKTVTADATNGSFALPNYTGEAVVTDNCGVGGITVTQSPAVGTALSGLTPHTITITAKDASNNTSQCTFFVTLTDNTPPQITTCVSNKTATANSNCEFVLPDYTSEAVATDNCGASGVTITQSPAAGTTVSGLLPHTVTITTKDASNNTTECTFTVTLTDNIAPQITTCVSNKTATANANCEFVLPDYTSEVVASDNCGVGGVAITQSPAAGTTVSGLLPHTITITAKDASNNSSQCTFTVTLTDNIAPQISGCPADITVSSESSSCGVTVTWTEPAASDNCSLTTFVGTPASGSVFAVGTTPVTYTATDSKGNTSTCSFNVTVKDETLPVITNCPSDITVSSGSTSCGATVSWTEPTATDNCSISTFVSTHAPGSVFDPGATTVTYTATDVNGKISTCSFKVTVNDETSPQISGCPSDITASAEANSCGATVNWTAPTASDNCSVSSFVSSHSPGSVFSAGTTVVKYTATDASGNTTQCSFNVIVTDNTPPVITCLSDIQVSANALCKASVQWTEPTISDCSNVTTTKSHDPGDVFEFGTTEVTYTATDSKGNSTTCKFNVIVKDLAAPSFTNCPGEVKATATSSCNAVVNWTAPSASDNCGIASVTSTHNSGDTFPMGTTVVKYTATDINGNTSVCQFNVIVANEHPVLFTSCPENIVVKAGESGQLAVEWTEPDAVAECSEVTITKTHASGDIFSLGQTEVIYQATDLAGNTAECKFVIDVSYEDIQFEITRIVTPDGDGINDVWKLENIEKFNDNVVTVVDRWGSVIYSASGYNNENIVWRGESQSGVLVPTGTYFYTIRVDFAGSHVEKRGFIELVR